MFAVNYFKRSFESVLISCATVIQGIFEVTLTPFLVLVNLLTDFDKASNSSSSQRPINIHGDKSEVIRSL